MKDILITSIALAPDAKITKALTLCGERFVIPVVYTLADGRTIPSTVEARRKKDIPDRLAREQNAASSGCMAASFNDAGEYWGTCTRYVIGGPGKGLVPAPTALDLAPTPELAPA